MKVRSIFISDIHLGSRSCKAQLLLHFLKEVEAENIYLVGDIIDIWSLRSSWYWPKSHSQVLKRLIKLSNKCNVVYIPGNHDEAARELCPFKFGNIKAKTWLQYKTLRGNNYVVLHGDIFDSFITNDKFLRALGNFGYDLIMWLNDLHHRVSNLFGKRYWSLAEYIRNHFKEASKVVDKFKSAACNYAELKGYDGIITGHIHKVDMTWENNIHYINTGDWVESCTAIVETTKGEWKVLRHSP